MIVFGSFLWADSPPPWVWDIFAWNALTTLTFGCIGIFLAVVGFKLFDSLTPGNLEEEIVKKQNLAAAILGAAIILGICLIVSKAVG
jgi:putative membrane protein